MQFDVPKSPQYYTKDLSDFKFDIMLPAPRCDLYPKIESPT